MKLLTRPDKLGLSAVEGPAPTKDDLNGILGRGSTFEGKLAFEGTVHLNGTFTGEIHSKGTLIIGESARVHGEIHAGTLIITGEVTGQLWASQLLELHAPARVRGSICAPTLVIDRGVLFEGTSRMENLDAPVAAPPPQPVKRAG